MKMILSTLIAVGVLAGAASAQTFDPFHDKSLALPRSSNDSFRDARPLIEETFPDVVIAKP